MSVRAVAIDLDSVLGDTRRLWMAFLEHASRRFHSIAPLQPDALPNDRSLAAEQLDVWATAGVGDWRRQLHRFAEDHAPVYLRPDAGAMAALRALHETGVRIGVYTDAPQELATVCLAQLGASRRIAELCAGADARARLLIALGPGASVAASRAQLDALLPR